MKGIFISLICLFCLPPSFAQVVYTREHRLNERVTVYSDDNGKTWGAKVDNKVVIEPEYKAVSLLGNRYLCLTKYDAESQTLVYGMANLAGIVQLDCEYEHMSMRKGQLVAFRAPEVFGDEDINDDSNVEYLAADEELLTVTVIDNIIGRKDIPAIDLGKLSEAKNNILAEAIKEKGETKIAENVAPPQDEQSPKGEEQQDTSPEVSDAEVGEEEMQAETTAESTESPQTLTEQPIEEEPKEDSVEVAVVENAVDSTESSEMPVVKAVEDEQEDVADNSNTKEEEAKVESETPTPSPASTATSRIDEDIPTVKIDELLLVLNLERDIDMEKDFLLADVKQKQQESQSAKEQMPFFPGGEGEMHEFIRDNLEYPEEAKVLGTQGKVLLRFLVAANGNTQDIEVVQSLEEHCDKEAMRIVKLMPRWEPALRDGVAVPIYFTLPISFYF